MHVKQQVKDFVHDVKRKFSSKHHRDSAYSTSSRDLYDGASSFSSSDNTDDSISSSSVDSLPATLQRKSLISFRRPHPSSSSLKQVAHRIGRVGSKRYRLFSAPPAPSVHVAHFTQSGDVSEPIIDICAQAIQDDQSTTRGTSQEDYPGVIDISANSVNMDTTSEDTIFRDSSQESCSDTSGTLVTTISTDFKEFISDSDSPFHSIHLQSDENSAPLISSIHSITPIASDPVVPPPMPEQVVAPAAATDDEEIVLAQSISSSPPSVLPSPSSPVPQASRTNAPVHPPRSTPASPASVYIPRLTTPSMFLPVPNVRLFPLSHSLVWWLAPRWSSRSGPLSTVSTFLPCSGNNRSFLSPRPSLSRPYPTFMFPVHSNTLPPPCSRHQ